MKFEGNEFTEEELKNYLHLRGFLRGKVIARDIKLSGLEEHEAYESEENDRQYSPFELFANEINKLGEIEEFLSDEMWQAFDNGISEGITYIFEEKI